MKSLRRLCISTLLGLLLAIPFANAASIARNFTIVNRASGKPINMTDYAGKVLFLDFFAYWCGPCRASSPVVEQEIAEYYRTRGGNANGVPVEVIGVNIEEGSPESTDSFIQSVGFKTVANDFGASEGAWAQFGQGGIPHFVIINGVAGGSHLQWEILHSGAGFSGATFYRALIDSIKPPSAAMAPKLVVLQPAGTRLTSGISKISFGTRVIGGRSSSKTFVIKNKGTLDLRKLSFRMRGLHASDFTITPPPVTSLGVDRYNTFKVTFSPSAAGTRRATILIGSNDPNTNPFKIRVSGQGVR